jgi:hypothetical protein
VSLYVCNVVVDGKPCGVSIPADEVGAELMRAHLELDHQMSVPYEPTEADRRWARRQARMEEWW